MKAHQRSLEESQADWVRIATSEGLPAGGEPRQSPAIALDFAAALMLCPAESAARALLRRDREGALAFSHMSAYFVEQSRVGRVAAIDGPTSPHTAFYYIAAGVHEFAEGFQAQLPDEP